MNRSTDVDNAADGVNDADAIERSLVSSANQSPFKAVTRALRSSIKRWTPPAERSRIHKQGRRISRAVGPVAGVNRSRYDRRPSPTRATRTQSPAITSFARSTNTHRRRPTAADSVNAGRRGRTVVFGDYGTTAGAPIMLFGQCSERAALVASRDAADSQQHGNDAFRRGDR
uniref:Uncharacterized protein n=1 Tax=Plectus sambesii TaxID=2011161 RepID=A0A914WVU0_9BILA